MGNHCSARLDTYSRGGDIERSLFWHGCSLEFPSDFDRFTTGDFLQCRLHCLRLTRKASSVALGSRLSRNVPRINAAFMFL